MARGTLVGAPRAVDIPQTRDLLFAAAIIAVAAGYDLVGSTAFSLVLLVMLAVLCWLRSALAVVLIPLAVPLFMVPKTIHGSHHLQFSLGETAIVLCAAIVLAQQLWTLPVRGTGVSVWRHLVPASPFELPALSFLAAATLAMLAARFHTVALREYREVVVEPMLYYWLILQRLRGTAGAAGLALAMVATGTLVAAMGAIQILFRPQDLVLAANLSGGPRRLVSAVYGNQNNLAILLDRATPIALALALFPAWLSVLIRDRVPRSAHSRLARVILILASLFMLVILYRTGSRGGELTVALCIGVVFCIWQSRRPVPLAAAAVLAALLALVARHRLYDLFSGGHGLSNLAHTSVWDSALRMLRDHPLLGVGPDNFLYYYSDDSQCAPGHIANWYYVQAGTNYERCISHPHNVVLDFWLSSGSLGFVSVLWLVLLFGLLGLRAYRVADAAWRGPILAALLGMLAMLLHGEVDNSYFLPDLAVFFWLNLGIVALATYERDG